ncbi:MAG: hypothetical protein ABI353_03530 [Isosphaeraceae bacterium]
MPGLRTRLSTILEFIAVVAVLLAFYRLKPRDEFLGIIPFELFVVLLAIILVNLAIMLRAFRRK